MKILLCLVFILFQAGCKNPLKETAKAEQLGFQRMAASHFGCSASFELSRMATEENKVKYAQIYENCIYKKAMEEPAHETTR